MKTITVDKEGLLKALKENKAIHIAEYEEMKIIYMEMAVKKAQIMLIQLEKGEYDTQLSIDLDRPRSSEDEYDNAIEMLAWEVEDNVTITETEYKSYIKDEWNFSRHFAMSKAAYLGL